jgi:predicted nucleic acid-binding Zn ribbon protein
VTGMHYHHNDGYSEPRPLNASFGRLLSSMGVDASPRAVEGVFREWRQVVGDQVATHAWPVSLRHGRLLVMVDHSAWASQLRYLGPLLLERFHQFVGEPVAEELVVRVEKSDVRRPPVDTGGEGR